MSSHVVLTFKCSSNFYWCSIQEFSKILSMLPFQYLGCAHQRTHQLARPKLRSSMMRLIVVVVSRSKNCQKLKNLKSLKSCKGHPFRRTFTKALIFCQCNVKVTRPTDHMISTRDHSHDLPTWSRHVTYELHSDIKASSIPISASPFPC